MTAFFRRNGGLASLSLFSGLPIDVTFASSAVALLLRNESKLLRRTS